MAATPPSATAKTAVKAKTSYHVLRLAKTPTGNAPGANTSPDSATATRNASYELVRADVQASNSDHAVRIHAEKAGDQAAGTYIAVPSRSWKPTTVTVQTQTILKLDNA